MTSQTLGLDIEQVALELGLDPNSIRKSIRQRGGLPSHRIGRRIIIMRRELDEWLAP